MQNMIVVITGSSKGIGFYLASEFLKRGHSVCLNGRDSDALNHALTKLEKTGPAVIACAGDVSQISTHERLITSTIERFGQIDVWINNAGIPQPYQTFTGLTPEEITTLLNVNLTGTMYGSQIAASFFLEQGYGSLYNMEGFGSDGRTMNKLSLYGTSKRAVRYFTNAFYKELKDLPLQIGTINPGMVRTDFLKIDRRFDNEEEKQRYEKVMDILAEDPEPVAQFIVDKILSNKKKFKAIKYLSGVKLAGKILKLTIS